MKKLVTVCVTCFVVATVQAQTLTEKYLKLIPALPKDTCNITRVNVDKFVSQVTELSDQLNSEVETLNNIIDQKMEGSEEVAQANTMTKMSQQYGLSAAQMQQIQNQDMSEEDKEALADQILKQQTNMSMGEVQNLSTMSEAGKTAYLEAYGVEMMATGQTQQNQQNASSAQQLNELISQQQAIMSKIKATSQKISDLYAAFENDPQLKNSDDKIDKWTRKLTSMMGEVSREEAKQMDSLASLIIAEKIMICNKFTPRMRDALKQHFQLMKSIIPDTYQLGQLTVQITKLQTGVVIPPESTEIETLGFIQGYLGKLENAYKYKLHFPEEA